MATSNFLRQNWSPRTMVYEGRLVPQYPYLSAVLSYPFYRLAGNRGQLVDSDSYGTCPIVGRVAAQRKEITREHIHFAER